ncbi:hypothetical protein [Krasilnikovia sp. MM14-A1259]|uniref:hypothetical protein n=1 Tax=Krasilnikovia sp. MM14-A1259 TaxID=3373539 RepID=UPI0038037250
MSMLAVENRTGDAGPRGRVSPPVPASNSNPRTLIAAIEHHRREGRRLAAEAKHHRTKLRTLLQQRNHHITELRTTAGWSLTRIGTLYELTAERIGQITEALRPSAARDDVTGVKAGSASANSVLAGTATRTAAITPATRGVTA